jgi:hypothetical protein
MNLLLAAAIFAAIFRWATNRADKTVRDMSDEELHDLINDPDEHGHCLALLRAEWHRRHGGAA